jgi:preprotein translocase subunit SecB
MTDAPENTSATDDNAANPAMHLRAQYTKDLSFENPNAPDSIFNLQQAPELEVNVNLAAQRLEEAIFELAIQINVRAKSDDKTVFLIDLSYAGIFELQNIPEDAIEQVIFVQGAFLLFPYARRVISDVSRDGGFPPLQLEPVDFLTMYQQQREHIQRQEAPQPGADSAPAPETPAVEGNA